MTYDNFKSIEIYVIEIVNEALDAVKEKSFPDYCLLLSHASYQYELEGTTLSPYVFHSTLEIRQDISHQNFLVSYLNQYSDLLKENVFFAPDYKEYNLNIQMMIYSHIWESHLFLKTLKRISDILNNRPYDWKIPFEYPSRKDPSKSVIVPKSKFIQENILDPIAKTGNRLSNLLNQTYHSQLRNDFAHASYFLDLNNGEIVSQDGERFMRQQSMSISEWEDCFVNTIMLSYHLSKALYDRLNSFVNDYPDIKEVIVDWPSLSEPGTIYKLKLFPRQIANGVEFCLR